MPIVPDAKDWTWVLEKPCPECGFDGPATAYEAVPGLVRDAAGRFGAVLERADATVRPDDSTWSALEYAAHVRDVCRVFVHRLDVTLGGPGTPPEVAGFEGKVGFADGLPVFENWDQDVTAVAGRYGEQDPATVAAELAVAAETVSGAFESVPVAERGRAARRSNGSLFTVDSMATYFVHDLIHHLHDVHA
ncbi:DinB family protein [Nocardia sp. CDC159]|uniref:DinB family protein n=1 Tax=Nocardia pulmonis TaxID=2951408 RepID=A0A9X2IY52_9NOCA|nr:MULTISPECIES: DinB family protein [Nocardia]MCM6773531.1 DinB family protein [Nocardia pulmonis]MCM6786418.1 DinB family protein [Nocardia sp. CDC159]